MRARLTAWFIILAFVLSGVHTASAQVEPDIGVSVRIEAEAVTVSSRQVKSDSWKTLASWLPYIGFLFTLSGREIVIQHTKALNGSFLGLPVEGEMVVFEVRKFGAMSMPTTQFVPGRITLKLPNGTLVMNAASWEGIYRFESDPRESSGVFGGVLARAELRIFGISDVNSLVRGNVVIGIDSIEKAERVLSEGISGQDKSRLREHLGGSRIVLMPFPPSAKLPERTIIRWMVTDSAGEAVTGQIRILVGCPISGERRACRLKVVGIPTGGVATVLHEDDHQPGEQVELTVRGAPPVVVMVFVDAVLVQQFKLQ